MSLDGVELLLAIEEEFGLDIPNSDAEEMFLVGDVYEYLKSRIASSDPDVCLTQRIFYKLRLALISNYQLERREVGPDTRLSDLLSARDLEEGWPYLQMFIDLKTPPHKVANEFLGFKLTNESLTVRELVSLLVQINRGSLAPQHDSAEGIWNRLVKVIIHQLHVNPEEVYPGASINRDLGCD